MEQWDSIEELYKIHLYPLLGVKIGNASDGDSKRRKAMQIRGYNLYNEGPRYTLNCDNFTVSGKIKYVDDTNEVYSLDIMDQDYIHNGKKLTYPLDHAKRVLMVGENMAHLNHLLLVSSRFDVINHGLLYEDLSREDRQNWSSAQRIFFPRVQACLQSISDGANGPPENVTGTLAYLQLGFRYIEIFCSYSATLFQRIVHASYVCNFLRIWRLWIYRHQHYNLKTNFITRECYEDVQISCHAAVLTIKAGRDFAPMHDVRLDLTGSDVCEDYFSQNGSFVLNKHNYTFADMIYNLQHMNQLLEIQSNPMGPIIPKKHKKQCNIWSKGTDQTGEKPDLKDFPTDDAMVEAWMQGLREAQDSCRRLGMQVFFFFLI